MVTGTADGLHRCPFDPSLADRTCRVAGGLLGDLGYWLADHGIDTAEKIAYIPCHDLEDRPAEVSLEAAVGHIPGINK